MSFGYAPDYKGKFFLKDLYLRIFGYPYPPRRNEARLVFKSLKPQKEEMILDLGSGDGVWYNELRKRGLNVVGIDVSEVDLRKAKKRAENMNLTHNFILSSGQFMPFKENTFDKIFSISTFEHISNDIDVFKECHRILKSNGIIVVSVPTDKVSYIAKLVLKMPSFIKKHFFSSIVVNSKNEEEYRKNFDKKFMHFRRYRAKKLIREVEKQGFILNSIDYNCKFFGSFFTGLFHCLKIFEWEKTMKTEYQFKNQLFFGLIFPLTYPLYVIDDLLFWIKGRGLVIKLKKGDKIV
jgi:ubiquinone/menaquinone biosynthesis C-methylase UbiE